MQQHQAEKIYQKALKLHQGGKFREAEVQYRKILKAFPKLDAIHLNLGVVLHQQQRHEPALKALDKALAINPTNIDAYVNRGTVLLALGRAEEACEVYGQVARQSPDNANAQYNYGNVLYQCGRIDDAVAAYQKAVQRNPQLHQAWFNLGNLLRDGGDAAEAMAAYEKALAAKPDYPAAYCNLGNLRADQGQMTAALAAFRAALEAQPDYSLAHELLGKTLLDLGRADEGLAAIEAAMVTGADRTDLQVLQVLRGNALRDLGKPEDAIAAYEAALAIAPDHAAAARNLSRLRRGLVPQWHLPMLADTARNDAFQAAIERAVGPEDVVLDIGTGSGLLAMMAARAGARKVYACESVELLARTAREIVANNGYADQIEVLAQHSGTVKVGQEMAEPATVLVSEILDAGLTGEGVLPSHRHALAELCSPEVKVIPGRAVVKAQLMALPEARKVNPVQMISGFDLSAFDRFRVTDEYTAVKYLTDLPHTRLSDVVELMEIDFRHLPPAADEDAPNTFGVTFTGQAEGAVHAVVFWFDLYLDAETMVSSGPEGELKHWGQAVYFLPSDISIAPGQTLLVRVQRTDFMWRFFVD